jgi:protein-disulfide isomerase/uncharacterized membrane protein
MNTETAPTTLPFQQPKPTLRWTALILAIAGWTLSLLLFQSVSSPSTSSGLLDAFCGPAAGQSTWDCQSVLRSKWGYAFGEFKMPVSALGMSYFAFVGLWYLLIGPVTPQRRPYHVIITLVILLGMWESARYTLIMAFELQRWCAACLATHAINTALLTITIAAWPWKTPPYPQRPHPTGRLALATTTACLLAAFAHLATTALGITGGRLGQFARSYREIVDDPEYILWNHRREVVADLNLRPDEVYAGNPDADHTIVVFSDFQCTACKKAHDALADLLRKYPDTFRIAYRYFPQDPDCNPHENFASGAHASACEAAYACEAARITGGPDALLQMRNLLYKRQALLDSRPFTNFASELGLDPDTFTKALASEQTHRRIAQDVQLGLELDISGVPIIYLDGRRLVGWSKPEIWDALLAPQSPPTADPAAAPDPQP